MSPKLSPDAIKQMTLVYERAVQELKLDRVSKHERDRLAVYILAVGTALKDPNRVLDRAIRMYHRLAKLDGLLFNGDNASATFDR
jgi:hypothetical protein